MATKSGLRSQDLSRLETSINDLEEAVGQINSNFESLEVQVRRVADTIPTLESLTSNAMVAVRTDMDNIMQNKKAIETYILEMRNKKIGSTKNQQNEFLQNNLPTFESIKSSLESIRSNLESQKEYYVEQTSFLQSQKRDLVNERSELNKHYKSLQSVITATRESLLIATSESIGWEISKTRGELRRRTRWLWCFIGLLIVVGGGWVVLGPVISPWIAGILNQDISNLADWQNFLVNRISLPTILSAPYFLIKKALDTTVSDSRSYQHKEVMLKTLIVFRKNLDEEDKDTNKRTISQMIEAISIPPPS